MSHADWLRDLLRPLGIYDLGGVYLGGELDAQGLALDGVQEELEELGRETDLTAAEGWGLDLLAGLLPHRPAAQSSQGLREALAALLRIGGDSFTLEAINDAIAGCGIVARVDETGEPGRVEVSFPGVPGIPEDFERIAQIVEAVLPAHLLAEYVFWYINWELLENKIPDWQTLEGQQLTWEQLEKMTE